MKKPGYILIFALMIVGLCMTLAVYIASRAGVFIPYARVYVDRQQAYHLAFSGVQFALGQLSVTPEPDKKKEQEQEADQKSKADPELEQARVLLHTLLPRLNRWQAFQLTEKNDGIDGSIRVCIMSEQGKLNINALYDFKKKQFISGHVKKVLEDIFSRIEKKMKLHNLFPALEQFLKKRKRPLDDVTELLQIKEFQAFKDRVYYHPAGKKEGDTPSGQLFLTDIFTIWTGTEAIEPFLISSSLMPLFGLREPDRSAKNVAAILKEMSLDMQWPGSWDALFAKWYQQNFASLVKNVENILSVKFEPKVFSVLSYGIFGQAIQRFFAIVERVKKESSQGHVKYDVVIRKLYWL